MKFSTAMAALLAIAAAVPSGSSAAAQTPPAANRAQISGTVTSVNTGAQQLSLKSDKGEDVSVTTTNRTLILRADRVWPVSTCVPQRGRRLRPPDGKSSSRVPKHGDFDGMVWLTSSRIAYHSSESFLVLT
jgi:hypothetical protein